ncbi:MAG: ATP-binding cassette domain-containing protein, partial [Hungatella sp.]
DKPQEVNDEMNIALDPNILSGKDVLTVRDLAKSFDSNQLFQHVDIDIARGERVAIIGNNGTGKTTLLKIINHMLPADTGEVRLGSKVQIGYYDQEHQVLHMGKTLFDELQDTYPDLNNTRIRNVLAAFLFTGDDVFKNIKDLSGGERGRVSLAKLMLSNANFLILDEPTNHLDITSKEILEHALVQYTGTVLYVSHDRYFVNKTATRILELTGETFLSYIGNYDYYLEKKDLMTGLYTNSDAEFSGEISDSEVKQNWKAQKEEQAKLRKQQNDLKKAEEDILHLETRAQELDTLLGQPDICSNAAKLMELHTEKESISEQLISLYEIWESLAQ